jgi:hypothetical protein
MYLGHLELNQFVTTLAMVYLSAELHMTYQPKQAYLSLVKIRDFLQDLDLPPRNLA